MNVSERLHEWIELEFFSVFKQKSGWLGVGLLWCFKRQMMAENKNTFSGQPTSRRACLIENDACRIDRKIIGHRSKNIFAPTFKVRVLD